jgi:hypothetical protein
MKGEPFWIDKEDEEIVREFKLSTGISIYFKKYPPHGMWRVSFERGAIPKKLEGEWSDYRRLYGATLAYLQNKRNPSDIVEEVKEETDAA